MSRQKRKKDFPFTQWKSWMLELKKPNVKLLQEN